MKKMSEVSSILFQFFFYNVAISIGRLCPLFNFTFLIDEEMFLLTLRFLCSFLRLCLVEKKKEETDIYIIATSQTRLD